MGGGEKPGGRPFQPGRHLRPDLRPTGRPPDHGVPLAAATGSQASQREKFLLYGPQCRMSVCGLPPSRGFRLSLCPAFGGCWKAASTPSSPPMTRPLPAQAPRPTLLPGSSAPLPLCWAHPRNSGASDTTSMCFKVPCPTSGDSLCAAVP